MMSSAAGLLPMQPSESASLKIAFRKPTDVSHHAARQLLGLAVENLLQVFPADDLEQPIPEFRDEMLRHDLLRRARGRFLPPLAIERQILIRHELLEGVDRPRPLGHARVDRTKELVIDDAAILVIGCFSTFIASSPERN
jgi:hypothetical protein